MISKGEREEVCCSGYWCSPDGSSLSQLYKCMCCRFAASDFGTTIISHDLGTSVKFSLVT